MRALALRTRPLPGGDALFVGDAGRFFAAGEDFLDRQLDGAPSATDRAFLEREGHLIGQGEAGRDLPHVVHAWRTARRTYSPTKLDYLILVPTLRCNLACSYCQVSRVDADRRGFDWSPGTLAAVLSVIDGLETDTVKIEFQGGEPTLRPDLIRAVIDRCARFASARFVVCTNLARLDGDVMDLLDREDVSISTSLDGDAGTHKAARTGSDDEHARFTANLDEVIRRYGPGKLSALPTVDSANPPDPDALIDAYASRGLNSIFLRPITFHGFARKRHPASRDPDDSWRRYHASFVSNLIERNWADRTRVLEETYLSICLRRIVRPGVDRHVDLREPNPVGVDYVVIDHDGRVYPTDEARMLTRSRVVDLSIGDVASGWDTPARRSLHTRSTNRGDPACDRCAYQPFCGRDLVDDIARYGTIDVPRHGTAFCRRHTHMFDLAFALIHSDDPKTRFSVARWSGLAGDMPPLPARAP